MQTTAKVFGQRLRALRQSKGWTQEDLGRRAHLDYRHIGAIERGQNTPSFDAVDRIAKAFGVEPFELFLPVRFLASGDLEAKLRLMADDPHRLQPEKVQTFLHHLLTAVQTLEGRGRAT